jgi:predicted MFS family arabinose efflux permease
LAIAYAPASSARVAHAKPLAQPTVGGEAGAPGSQQNSHHSSFMELAAFASVISRPLAKFLSIWFISYTAMNGVAVLFPVVMTDHYGMSPIMPALTYAIGVCASIVIYGPVSRWTTKHGPGKTLFAGLALRLALFLALTLFSFIHAPYIGVAVLVTFALIQFVWPLLAVSTIAMSVSLARQAPGESIGLYNATSSIASSAGAAIGGLIFGLYGFAFFSCAAMLSVALSVFLARSWFNKSAASAPKVVV